MKTSDLVTMISELDACKIPGDQCPIPSTEDPEASTFQEWSIHSSDISNMLSAPMNNEQLDLNFSFDMAKLDDMPWYSDYCSLQKNNELSYTMFQPMSLPSVDKRTY